MIKYKIEKLSLKKFLADADLRSCLLTFARDTGDTFENKLDWKNFDIETYIDRHRFMLCWRGEALVGVMLSRLFDSIMDPQKKILQQDLLFARPGTRAAYLLFEEFLDFGKQNASHLITMLTSKTNIKRRSLEKFGFKELETLYRLEV